ncbi:MAG: response regulator [Casimicrobiaceae bacterium]
MAIDEIKTRLGQLALRVLVVDDNADGAEALCVCLALMGCTTSVALDGRQGLAIAATFEPQLAFIDLEMPDMSGVDVARQLKSARSSARLICLTGRSQPEDRRLCIDAGFDEFLSKPLPPEKLQQVLDRVKAAIA